MFFMGFASVMLYAAVLEAPPRDFVSLIAPGAALERLGMNTDAPFLIAFLKGEKARPKPDAGLAKAVRDLGAAAFAMRKRAAKRLLAAGDAARPYLDKAAKSDDPEVSVTARSLLKRLDEARRPSVAVEGEFVRRIYAIRRLAALKSKAAVPVLTTIAKGGDIVLADLAKDALAVIAGRKPPRPSGLKLAGRLAALAPEKCALVALVDFARGATDTSAWERMQKMMNAFGGGAAGAFPDRMRARIEGQVLGAIQKLGNLRLDAAAVYQPNSLTGPRRWPVIVVAKGAYDPERLRKALVAEAVFNERKETGAVVVSDAGGRFAVCLKDAGTAVLVFGGGDKVTRTAMTAWLQRLGKPSGKVRNPLAKSALAALRKPTARLVAVGRPTKADRKRMRKEVDDAARQPRRDCGPLTPLLETALRAADALAEMDRFSGTATTKLGVDAEVACADAKRAKNAAAALTELDKQLRGVLDEQNFGPFGRMGIDTKKPFWTAAAKGAVLSFSASLKSLRSLPALMFIGMRVRHAVPRPVGAIPGNPVR